MRTALHSVVSSLWGIGLVGGLALLAQLAAAGAGPTAPGRGLTPGAWDARADTVDAAALRTAEGSAARRPGPGIHGGPPTQEQSAPRRAGSPSPRVQGERSWQRWGLNVLVGILLALLTLLAAVAPFVVLAVSLVMDGGCLRYVVFAGGWVLAFVGGAVVTAMCAVVAVEALGLSSGALESGAPVGVMAFLLGYPIAAWGGRRWLRALPRGRRRAWKRTLTGGALFGVGAGATAGLAPSVGGGFGGFGGGSFGGGGASGSWSASSAGGAAAAGAVPSGGTSSAEGGGTRLNGQWRRVRWPHAAAFVLAGLSFAALGAWVVAALQQKIRPGVVTLLTLWALAGFALWRWLIRPTTRSADRDFRGGAASASWS